MSIRTLIRRRLAAYRKLKRAGKGAAARKLLAQIVTIEGLL